MKKTLYIKSAILFSAALILLGICSVSAVSATHSWYCVHRKDHKQPTVGTDISFVENYGGIFIDHSHGDDCEDKVIYLTFDAGYENGNVEKILDVLKSENVPGAFFILGNLVKQNASLVNRMFNEGHLVCNHTYSHNSMIGKTKSEFETELNKLERECYEMTGKQMAKFYRPPEGKFDESTLRYANELGYKTVFWSFAYADWDNDKQMAPEKAKEKILSCVHNGEIMLLHPTSATNAEILTEVIRELKSQGFRFSSLNELGKG